MCCISYNELLLNIIYSLVVAHSRHCRLKEEEAQNSKENNYLEQNKPPKLSAPGHIPKPVNIKTIYLFKGIFHELNTIRLVKIHKNSHKRTLYFIIFNIGDIFYAMDVY